MKFEDVHDNRRVMLLQSLSGSKAYGLDTPESDTDIKGVFFLPRPNYFGLDFTEQVNNESNDIVYYELRRFIELLLRNNPNILELLSTPSSAVLFRHPLMDMIKLEFFLSKVCLESFAGYAQTQIRKAKGLNKKIFNPIPKEKKTVPDFCYVVDRYRTRPLNEWLLKNGFRQEDCGLNKIAHVKDLYGLFSPIQLKNQAAKGIYSGSLANDVQLTSVPEKTEPSALLVFNKDGYSAYCKDYKAYWDWVEKRNEQRFENTLNSNRNYDAKNMMHTFRLLNMAEEIATEHRVNVFRKDRQFLLQIKSGFFEYEELVRMADEKIQRITELYASSDLPDAPDANTAEDILIRMREKLYS